MKLRNWHDFENVIHLPDPKLTTRALCGFNQAEQRRDFGRRVLHREILFKQWTVTNEAATCVLCIGLS